MTKRYDQLLTLIDEVRPLKIVEVGVHRAIRSHAMCARAIRSPKQTLHYVGYDVFETMDQAFQDAAMNGKGMPTKADAERNLRRLHGFCPNFAFLLVVGDTRETLHGREVACDFAFIDGDHRVECIRADYESIISPMIVFDDYYEPDAAGHTVDLTKFGANVVVDEIRAAGGNVEILPAADPCKHGGVIKLAVVRR